MLAPDTLILDGRFRVLRPLGSGGMGEVYLGEQVSLGRKVAIKVLHHDLHLAPGMSERFKREARLLSAVEHPAVVRVIDYGESEGAACIVMEFAEGVSLHDAINEGPFSPARALPLLRQLAEGLAAIHDKGIIHRDLKPENVVLSRGPRGELARLLDFGIARLAETDASSGLSQVGVVLGTPEYLSPEQAVGSPAEPRSDLYSFGVLAFRVLSGRLPFEGPEPRQYLAQHAHGTPLPLIDAAPSLSGHPALVALVMRLLEKDPANRLQSAHSLADALAELLLAATAPTASSVPAPSPESSVPSGTVAFGPPDSVPTPAAPSGTSAFGAPAQPEARPVLFVTGGTAPPPSTSGTAAYSVRPSGPVPSVGSGTLSLKSQNLAVMLTDIQGFTERTSRQTREENARMLETHDTLLPPLVREYNGRLVQRRGDALLAVFRSPTESVLCGMAMQDRLWRHNQGLPPEEQLHVRVCIHAGEVLLSRDSVLGEPVEVVAAVEKVAAAGDVTFTEAVNLARNRTEADAEPCGTIPLPGRDEQLQLYRCQRAAEGSPFGDRFEARKPGLRVRLGPGMSAASAWLRTHAKPVLAVGTAAALLLGGGAAVVAHQNDPVVRARAALEAGKLQDAQQLLKAVPEEEAKGNAEYQQVYARVQHARDEHVEEHKVLMSLDEAAREDLGPEVLAGLAEDFGENEGDPSVRRVLNLLPKKKLHDAFAELAEGDFSLRQWGALRILDTVLQDRSGLNLSQAYVKALASKNCALRATAANRLGALGDRRALPALKKLADLPKEKSFIISKNCGQDEATEAIQTLKKKSD